MTQPTITALLIVKNEEEHLPRCLGALSGKIDEIVVVDTGSNDRTKEIAAEHGAVIADLEWKDDFAAARNFALEHATGDWILDLGADEEVTSEAIAILREITNKHSSLENTDKHPFYTMLINDTHSGSTTKMIRFWRAHPDIRFFGAVHERPRLVEGSKLVISVEDSSAMILHYGYHEKSTPEKSERNIRILKKALENEPDNGEYHYLLALEYQTLGEDEAAIECYVKALNSPKEPPPALAYRNLMVLLMHKEDYKHAQQYGIMGIRRFADYADLYFLLGNAYLELGDLHHAKMSFARAVSSGEHPDRYSHVPGTASYLAFTSLGFCAMAENDPQKALEQFTKALRSSPDKAPILQQVRHIFIDVFGRDQSELDKYLRDAGIPLKM